MSASHAEERRALYDASDAINAQQARDARNWRTEHAVLQATIDARRELARNLARDRARTLARIAPPPTGSREIPRAVLFALLVIALVAICTFAPGVARAAEPVVNQSLTTARAPCSWANPGADPYRGGLPAAVDSYRDIAPATRARLKAQMQAHAYDDIVAITADGLAGKYRYAPTIRDMHFGNSGKRCAAVSTVQWPRGHTERGLVYCADDTCILVPTVCNNVSRVDRIAAPEVVTLAGGAGGAPAFGSWPALPALPPFGASAPPLVQNPLVPDTFVAWHDLVPVWIPNAACCGNSWRPPLPPIPAVPEPPAWAMLAIGGAGIAVAQRLRIRGRA